jgi:hypothetical protein
MIEREVVLDAEETTSSMEAGKCGSGDADRDR